MGCEPKETDIIEIGRYKYKNCKKNNNEGAEENTSKEIKNKTITDKEIKRRV